MSVICALFALSFASRLPPPPRLPRAPHPRLCAESPPEPHAEQQPFRVCTFGGQGSCSGGEGKYTLDALRFLMPEDGPGCVSCSCLARCDRGVAVRRPDDEIDEEVNGAAGAAKLLQDLGYSIDRRLTSAHDAARRGDELVAAGRDDDALNAYKRAFSLAIASGIGLEAASGRSERTTSRNAPWWQGGGKSGKGKDRTLVLEPGAIYIRGEPRGSGGALGGRYSSTSATKDQLRWLVRVLTRRSRVYSKLATPTAAAPLGKMRPTRRALEDAQYAVRLAESLEEGVNASAASKAVQAAGLPPEVAAEVAASGAVVAVPDGANGADPVLLEAWERLAEAYELARDIDGSIIAYERLLTLEPASTPGLAPATSAKRGVQELVLLSHKRGLEDTKAVTSGLQRAGESSRQTITTKAISDVETLRKKVERDTEEVEKFVRDVDSFLGSMDADAMAAAADEPSSDSSTDDSEQQSTARKDGQVADLLERLRYRAVDKSLSDLRVIRKLALQDINRLELTLLRGDPLLAFIRDIFMQKGEGEAKAEQLFELGALGFDVPDSTDVSGADQGSAAWLREQFVSGALPKDPLLVRSLLEKAKEDPELVARLVRETKNPTSVGQKSVARNPTNFGPGFDGALSPPSERGESEPGGS